MDEYTKQLIAGICFCLIPIGMAIVVWFTNQKNSPLISDWKENKKILGSKELYNFLVQVRFI